MDVLEAVLSGSWDRRVASKLHSDQLRKMELEPAETLILDLHRHDASFHGLEATAAEIQWTRHQTRRQEQQVRMHRRAQQVEQLEEQQKRLEAFFRDIGSAEREGQRKMLKEEEKILRLKHQETSRTAVDSISINA